MEHPHRVSAELLVRLFDEVTTAVMAVNGNSRVVVYNTEAAEVLGMGADHVLDQTLDDLQESGRPPSIRALAAALQSAIVSGRDARRITLDIDESGTSRTLGCTVTPLGEPAEPVSGGIAVFNDITDEQRRERERTERLCASHVQRIVSSLAHQIKNPLAAIKMYASIAAREGGPEVREVMEVVLDQVGLAQSRMTDAQRSVSRSTEVAPRRPAVTRLDEAVPACLEKDHAGLPHATVRLDVSDYGLDVPLAEDDVSSIISNLVNNASEATSAPGQITVSLARDGSEAHIVIEDTGSGFPTDDPESLFQPFFTSKPRNAGLGLWVVKRIVSAVGGDVLLENRSYGGARVTVRLPLLQLSVLRGKRILVVEDEDVLRRVLARQLQGLGATIYMAASGKEALGFLTGERPDALVTDVRMPGVDGVELTEHAGETMPVLIISGVADAEQDHPELMRKGLAFLSKPFEGDELGLALAYVIWEVAS